MKRIMLLPLISLFLLSCKNENYLSFISENLRKDSIQVELPDRIPINQTFKGELQYFSPLDSIKLSEKVNRFTFLYTTTDTVSYESIDSIKSSKNYKAFIKEIGESFIPYQYKFTILGENYFSGIIKDQVILDNYYEDGKSRIITNEVKMTIKVKVVKPDNY